MHVLIPQVIHLFNFHENFSTTFQKETELLYLPENLSTWKIENKKAGARCAAGHLPGTYLPNNGLSPTRWPHSGSVFDSNLSRMSACHEPWG